MLEVESRPRGGEGSFYNMTNYVKGQVNDMVTSGRYYVSPEIQRELKHIDAGIDNIKLDHQLLNSSKEWGQIWGEARTARELHDAANAIQRTSSSVDCLKGQLGIRSVSSRQDNEVRKQHHQTIEQLKANEQDLEPHAYQSTDRIRQFCDHIGVTDRYTGYRNNLSRGSKDPVKLGFKWLQKPVVAGFGPSRSATSSAVRRVPDPRATASATGPVLKRVHPITANSMDKQTISVNKSIQEQCGINTTFPGNTEYMVRYRAPPTDQKTVDFTVNPIPNTGAHGRPQACISWEPRNSEYQRRYEWPDSEKITKLPWMKKF